MKISYNWLRQYIDINVSQQELAERLTMSGIEVESVEDRGEKYKNFVVGQVLNVRPHPNADRLRICDVTVGSQTLQIVCGAPNVVPLQKVPVGLIGATVPHNQHDPDGKPFLLSHITIRGEESYGMICSEYELGFGENKNGIMVFDQDAEVGISLSKFLHYDDIVLDVSITPNRPDAMSHIGIAREIGAFLKKKVTYPTTKISETKLAAKNRVEIQVEDSVNCPRYSARIVFGVSVADSPRWLQERLQTIGIRPVNNVVDITNYVLMEYGQPIHAFDYDKISGRKVVVRTAHQGESLITLDHKTRTLREDTLLICDEESPIAIAGIMGGKETEIGSSTKNVFIECAYFHPQSIRRSAKHYGLSTDASQRFERGADPNNTVNIANRVASLIQSICGGEILRGVIDIHSKKVIPKKINVRVDQVNNVLGTEFTALNISSILQRLSIEEHTSDANRKNRIQQFTIPTYRPDLVEEIDLIEEIARVYGYNNVQTKVRTNVLLSENAPVVEFIEDVRSAMIGNGFREIVSNSMQEKSAAQLASDKIVEIANPVSKDMAAMRTSLVPGMLNIIRNNIFHGARDLRLFEIGKVYSRNSGKSAGLLEAYREESRLLLAFVNSVNPLAWDQRPRVVDIFDVKGEVQTLFDKIFLDKSKFIPYSTTNALTQAGIHIEINREDVGYLGIIRKDILTRFEIEPDVFVAELDIRVLEKNVLSEHRYVALPKYPSVSRDLALVVDRGVPIENIEKEIVAAGVPLLRSIELFDVYDGDQIAQGKKSCAYALHFLSEDHTLTQEEIEKAMRNILNHATHTLGATLRSI